MGQYAKYGYRASSDRTQPEAKSVPILSSERPVEHVKGEGADALCQMVQGDVHHRFNRKLTGKKPLPDCLSAYTASSPACAAACLPSELGMADQQRCDTGSANTVQRNAHTAIEAGVMEGAATVPGRLRTRLLAPTDSPCGRRCCMIASDRDSPKSAIFTTPSCEVSETMSACQTNTRVASRLHIRKIQDPALSMQHARHSSPWRPSRGCRCREECRPASGWPASGRDAR